MGKKQDLGSDIESTPKLRLWMLHTKGAFTTPWLMVNQKFRNAINH